MSVRILLVDNEESVRKSVSLFLGDYFKVDAVASGEEALLANYARGSYATVITDLQLSGMSGRMLLQRLADVAPTMSRLVFTADTDVEDMLEAEKVGHIFKLLRKPCPIAVMHEMVNIAVQQHRKLNARYCIQSYVVTD